MRAPGEVERKELLLFPREMIAALTSNWLPQSTLYLLMVHAGVARVWAGPKEGEGPMPGGRHGVDAKHLQPSSYECCDHDVRAASAKAQCGEMRLFLACHRTVPCWYLLPPVCHLTLCGLTCHWPPWFHQCHRWAGTGTYCRAACEKPSAAKSTFTQNFPCVPCPGLILSVPRPF